MWFNVIVFTIALLSLPEFLKILSPALLPYDLLGGAVGNLILRIWFTDSPIAPVTISFKTIDTSPAKAVVPTQADV